MKQSKQEILLETGTNEVEIAEFGIFHKGKKEIASYGINIAKVREIIKIPSFISIPKSHHNIMGVFKLRNKLIPLINLADWLGEETQEVDLNKCYVVVTEFNKSNFGFLIHTVEGIHRLSWEKVLSPSNLSNDNSNLKINCITGLVTFNDRIMLMIDFEKIVADINPELSLSIETDMSIVTDPSKMIGGKPKVLLAEDSSIVRELLTNILIKGGFDIIHFNNGKDAMAFLKKSVGLGKPITDLVKLVITDIEMPQMDGHSFCKQIKESSDLNSLPVVLFSSLIYDEIRKKGEMIGADAQISKPEIGSLLNIVRDLILKNKDSGGDSLSNPGENPIIDSTVDPKEELGKVSDVDLSNNKTISREQDLKNDLEESNSESDIRKSNIKKSDKKENLKKKPSEKPKKKKSVKKSSQKTSNDDSLDFIPKEVENNIRKDLDKSKESN